jgi:LacI family transcriptional regulator
MIVEGGYSEEAGYKSFEKLVETNGVPKAVFTVTYPVGLGALNYMKEHGINPSEVKVLSFGKSDFNEYLNSPFICIDQPTQALGSRAVKQLLTEINSEEEEPPVLTELSCEVLT